jgi:ZIP family zinc transporter
MDISLVSTIIILGTAAGICIPVGGLIASFEHIRPNWLEQEFRHFLIAFGGGILLGAVSVVLVPEGTAFMGNAVFSIPVVLAGGLTFFLIERLLDLRRRESPQLMAMVLDYVPEAIALGGLIALGSPIAPLLALLIGLQNLPEGFNAYRELRFQNNEPPGSTRTVGRDCWLFIPLGARTHNGSNHAIFSWRHSLSDFPGYRATIATEKTLGTAPWRRVWVLLCTIC